MSLFKKCKQSQPVIQRIIESTTNDEAMLFEALNLNDELQQVISRYEELEAGLKSGAPLPESCDNTEAQVSTQVGHHSETKVLDSSTGDSTESSGEKRTAK